MTHTHRTCTFPGGAEYCTGHENQRYKGRELTPLRQHRRVVDGHKVCAHCCESKPVDEFSRKGKYYQENCRHCRNLKLRATTYGLDIDEVTTLMSRPCDVCGEYSSSKTHHIDHDHVSGEVRGVLCHGCNTSLGLMRERPDLLRRLASYAESH